MQQPATEGKYFHYFSFGLGAAIDRLLLQMREEVYRTLIASFAPTSSDTLLDVGASADDHASSNFLEKHYPWTDRITALGIGDFAELEQQFPGLRYVKGDGRSLPFLDDSFDLVYSHAVVEHVGSRENQVRFVRELVRVARRGVLFTTPNRWHPLEFHTGLPLLHFLPRPVHHAIYRAIGKGMYGTEENHRLLGKPDLRGIVRDAAAAKLPGLTLSSTRWLGLPANLIAVLKPASDRPR